MTQLPTLSSPSVPRQPPVPAAHTAPTAQSWSQAPYGLVRVAGLPTTSLHVLDTPRVLAAVQEYLHLEQQVSAGREALSAQLSEQVRRVGAQPALLQATIRMRRALYSGKGVRPQDLRRVLPTLPRPLRRRVQRTLARLNRQQTIQVGFADTLARDRRQVSAGLRRLLREQPDFLAALETVNGTLSDSLRLYLEPAAPERDWRKLELTLLSYLMRASVKTSPLSRLAWNVLTSGVDAAGPAQSAISPLILDTAGLYSQVTLHGGVIRRLFQAAQLHPALKEYWPYAVNPDLSVFDSEVRGARRERGVQVTDQLIALERPGVARLLAALRQAGPLRRDEVLALLRLRLGGAQAAGTAETLFEQLCQQQFLVSAHAPRDDTEPLTQLTDLLDTLGTSESRGLAAVARQVQAELTAYSQGGAPERRQSQQRLTGLLDTFVAHCGQPAAQWPRRLLYENTAAHAPAPWLPALDGAVCRALATLASLFDAHTQTTLDQSAAFVRRYHAGGICHDPLPFLLRTAEDQRDSDTPREPLTAGDRRALDQLESRRQHLREGRRELVEALTGQRHLGQMTLDLDWLEELRVRRALKWPTRSINVFLQRGAGRYVLNGLSAGHGALLLRHLPAAPQTQALARRMAWQVQQLWPEGQVVQLVPNSESSVNRVPRLLPRTLALPTTPLDDPGELRLRHLHLRHDPLSNELHFYTQAGRVIPLYLGTLTPRFLAPLDRAVAATCPSLSYQSALLTELETRAGPRQAPRHWPRVMLGPVVVVRESWVFDPAHLPQRLATDDDFTYWCRVQRWLDTQGLPTRFFAHSFEAWRHRASNTDQGQEAFAKPHYFDLDQYHFVRLFERWTRDLRGTWCLQEVEPDLPGDVQLAGTPHIAETCCELSLGGSR